MPTITQLVGWGLSVASAACLVLAAYLKGGAIPALEAAGYSFGALATIVGTINVASAISTLLPRKP